ncbi:hypothetical protein M8J75_003919 [Diaphorina citri]|nr:hypothetical protein M8J75_003919 [Diaphorina citri]
MRKGERTPNRIMSGTSSALSKLQLFLEEDDDDDMNKKRFQSTIFSRLSDRFETVDFSLKSNKITNHYDKTHSKANTNFDVIRWMAVFLIAFAIAVLVTIIKFCVHHLSTIKRVGLHTMGEVLIEHPIITSVCLLSYNLFFMCIACGVCLKFSMEAAGGNVAGVIAYLNGCRIKNFFTTRTVCVKVVSTIAQVCTAVPGDMEGPIIHIGGAIGNLLPTYLTQIKYFPSLNNLCTTYERRDLSACGVAAGLAAGFGAPLSGIFLTLEETTSYFNTSIVPRIAACAFLCKFVTDILVNILTTTNFEFNYRSDPHVSEVGEHNIQHGLNLMELGIVIGFGVIGAFLSALFLYFVGKLGGKEDTSKMKCFLFTEALTYVIVSTGFYSIMLMLFATDCTINEEDDRSDSKFIHINVKKDECPPGTVPVMGVFLVIFEEGFHAVLNSEKGEFSLGLLTILFFFFYIFSIFFTRSHCFSSGFYLNQYVIGALWGRIVGELFCGNVTEDWAEPKKFALLGAAAQLTGTTQTQVCIVCMILEGANCFESYGIQIFLVSCTSRMITSFLHASIYHTILDKMGAPSMESYPPYMGSTTEVKSLLNTRMHIFKTPVITTVNHLLDITTDGLKGNYPVVNDSGVLMGDISQCLLLKLLSVKVFNAPQPFPEASYSSLVKMIYTVDCSIEYVEQMREDMFDNLSSDDGTKVMDLSPFMNKHVYYVQRGASLKHVYGFLRQMGMRTLYVVDKEQHLIAVITRKDVARFKTHFHMFHFVTHKVRTPSTMLRLEDPINPTLPPDTSVSIDKDKSEQETEEEPETPPQTKKNSTPQP